MAKYKTFKKQRYVYFWLALAVYFVPFTVVAAALLPFVEAETGFKIALGLTAVFINTFIFLLGAFRTFTVHFPFFNFTALMFLLLSTFFAMDVFKSCVDALWWIEFAAFGGGVVACVFWAKHRKYAHWNESIKANVRSGAFRMNEEDKT